MPPHTRSSLAEISRVTLNDHANSTPAPVMLELCQDLPVKSDRPSKSGVRAQKNQRPLRSMRHIKNQASLKAREPTSSSVSGRSRVGW